MNKTLIYILAFLFVNQVFLAKAQDVSFTAQAKSTVSVGERFNLTFTVNAQGNRFRGSQINDFNILSGPNMSTSSSMQFINGQMTHAVSQTYTYVLEAVKEGTFTIPAALVNVNGTDYQSNSLNITVVQGSTPPQQQQQQEQKRTQTDGEEIFLRASVNKNNPIQGEQIIVTYKIYTTVPVSQYTIDRLASFSGFWSENLSKENERPVQTQEVINGINYTVAEVRKIALFPQRSGTLTIEPLEMECVVQRRVQRQRQSIFDDFFFNPFSESVQNVRTSIRSNPLTINASPLPTQNRTAEFSGNVGRFNFDITIDKTELSVNEAANLSVKISGNGNLRMVEEPAIIFPPNLEAYDPRVEDKITLSSTGVSGSRTFNYLIIPRSAGEFKINPLVFSFFNPTTRSYETLLSDAIILNVERGDGVYQGTAVAAVSREDVRLIGSDIRFIKNDIFPLRHKDKVFYSSFLFWCLLFLPFVLFILFVILWRRQIKLATNTVHLRNRIATKMARKRLKKAEGFSKINDYNNFYDEVARALWGYFNFKFNIPYSDLSKEAIIQTFTANKIDESTGTRFIKIIDDCEFARYAPGDKNHTMEQIFKDAFQIITMIEKALK